LKNTIFCFLKESIIWSGSEEEVKDRVRELTIGLYELFLKTRNNTHGRKGFD
jgi:hypothetical protein